MSIPTNSINTRPYFASTEPNPPTKSDQVQALINTILAIMQKRLHKSGNVYLVENQTRQVIFIDDESTFNKISYLALQNKNLAVSNSVIQTAKRVLKAEFDTTPGKISLRIGVGFHAHFIDFGDGSHFIRYSADGAENVASNRQPVHAIDVDFLRPPNLTRIEPIGHWNTPTPTFDDLIGNKNGNPKLLAQRSPCLNQILELINAPEDYDLIIVTWMVCALLPEHHQTALEITGEDASGKSTAAWIIKSLIDPSDKCLNEIPCSPKELASIAHNNYIIAIDNADELSELMQSKIFELLTSGIQSHNSHGSSWSKLYRNPVIVTSTASMLSQKSLAKQSISISLPNIINGKSAQFINREFLKNHPHALLELTKIAAHALKNSTHASLSIDGQIYFNTFTLTGAAVCDYYGIDPSKFIVTLKALKNEVAENIIDNSAVARALLSWARSNPKSRINKPLNLWHNELKALLSNEEHDDWPKTTRKFGAELKKVAPRLRSKGVYCQTLGKQGSNIHWEIRVEPTDSS